MRGYWRRQTYNVVIRINAERAKASIDKLRYAPDNKSAKSDKTKELAGLKIRWKYPQGKESQLVEFPLGITINAPSEDMRFRAAVAAYGQKLRGSEYLNNTSPQQIKQWAQQAKGEIHRVTGRNLFA